MQILANKVWSQSKCIKSPVPLLRVGLSPCCGCGSILVFKQIVQFLDKNTEFAMVFSDRNLLTKHQHAFAFFSSHGGTPYLDVYAIAMPLSRDFRPHADGVNRALAVEELRTAIRNYLQFQSDQKADGEVLTMPNAAATRDKRAA
jgi:hypothetical protein